MERVDRSEDNPHQHHRHYQRFDILAAERALDHPLVAAESHDAQEQDGDNELVAELTACGDEIERLSRDFFDNPRQPAGLAGHEPVADQRGDQDQDELGRVGEDDADHPALVGVDTHHDGEDDYPPVEADCGYNHGACQGGEVHHQAQLACALERVHPGGNRVGSGAVAQAHELRDRGQAQAAEAGHDKQAAEGERHVAGPLVPDDTHALVGGLAGLGDEIVHPQVAGGHRADHQYHRHLTVGEVEIIGMGYAAAQIAAQAQHERKPDKNYRNVERTQHVRSLEARLS